MNFFDKMFRAYGGNSGIGNKTKDVLRNADMSKTYGPFEFFMAQYGSLPRSHITTAVQDALAAGIRNEVDAYVNFRNRDGGSYGPGDIPGDPEALNVVMGQPLPVGTMIAGARVGEQTLGQIYPELGMVNNVGDAMNLLFSANVPGIDARMNEMISEGLDFGGMSPAATDYLNGVFPPFVEKTLQYQPGRSGYTRYIQQAIFQATVGMTRDEAGSADLSLTPYENGGVSGGLSYTLDDLLLQAEQSDGEVYRARHPQFGSPAYKAGVPTGTQLDLSGYTPGQMEEMIAQVKAGNPISIPDKYGNPLVFQTPPAVRRVGAPPRPQMMLWDHAPSKTGLPAGEVGPAVPGYASPVYDGSPDTHGANRMSAKALSRMSSIEAFNLEVNSRERTASGEVDWRNEPYKPIVPVEGRNPIINKGDAVMRARLAYDKANKGFDKGRSARLANASDTYQDDYNQAAYDQIAAGFGVDMSYPAAQMQVNGALTGWTRGSKEMQTPEEDARSKAELKALQASGVVKHNVQRAISLHRQREDQLDFPYREEDPFGPGDMDAPASRVVTQRRVGSDVGNTPNVRGSQAWGTPAPRRNRRDKVFGAIDDGSTPMPVSTAASSGGGNGRTPPPPPPDDPNDFFSGADDWGDHEGDPFQPDGSYYQYQHTPTPNRLIREGLNRGSTRSASYNPSINPLSMAGRAFGSVIGKDASKWGQETGWSAGQIAVRTGMMFEDYLSAEGEGIGDEYVNNNVPQSLRTSFSRAARRGAMAYERAVRFAENFTPENVMRHFSGLENRPEGPALGYHNNLYGDGGVRDKVNPSTGEVIGTEPVIRRDGEVVFGPEPIQKGVDIARQALMTVSSSELPSEPGSAVATIRSRINSIITKQVEDFGKAMEGSGASRDDIQKATGYLKDAALEYTRSFSDKVGEDLVGLQAEGHVGARDEADARYGARKFADINDARETLDRRPGLRSQVESYMKRNGTSLEGMMGASGEDATVFEDGDMAFQFGGSGPSRGGRQSFSGRINGLWKGPVGSLMYGAYIGQRMWNMGMGETVAAAKAYGNYASGIGNIGGSGAGALSGDAGFGARQSLGELYAGRGAYQEFGSFMDLPFYLAAGGNDSSSRLLASAKAGLTTAAEFSIGGAMMGMIPGAAGTALAGAASALPIAGAVIGGGMLLGTAGMELYNAAHPGAEQVSWSSMFKSAIENNWRAQAESRFLADHPEWRSANRGQADSVYAKMYGAQTTVGDPRNITFEDLKPYLTPEQIGAMNPIRNEKVDAAMEAGKGFFNYGLDASAVTSATQALFKAAGSVSPELVEAMGGLVQQYGTQGISEAAQFASNAGYLTGTVGFTDQMKAYAAETDPTRRAQMMNQASRYAQMGSQVSGYMSADNAQYANQIAAGFRIQTQAKAGAWMRMDQAIANYQSGPLSIDQQMATASIAANNSPYTAGVISDLGNLAGMAGQDPLTTMQSASLAGAGFTPQQWHSRWRGSERRSEGRFILRQPGPSGPEVGPVRQSREIHR